MGDSVASEVGARWEMSLVYQGQFHPSRGSVPSRGVRSPSPSWNQLRFLALPLETSYAQAIWQPRILHSGIAPVRILHVISV